MPTLANENSVFLSFHSVNVSGGILSTFQVEGDLDHRASHFVMMLHICECMTKRLTNL